MNLTPIAEPLSNHGVPVTIPIKHKPTHTNTTMSSYANHEIPSFEAVKKMKEFWYRPKITRHEAVELLKCAPTGSFVIRDSTSYTNGLGLAVKIAKLTEKILDKVTDQTDIQAEHVRHYLIEGIPEPINNQMQYLLKGSAEEKIYKSLERLVFKHLSNQVSLPVKLNLKLYYRMLNPSVNMDVANKTLSTETFTESVSHVVDVETVNTTSNIPEPEITLRNQPSIHNHSHLNYQSQPLAMQPNQTATNNLVTNNNTTNFNHRTNANQIPVTSYSENPNYINPNSINNTHHALLSTYPIYTCHLVYIGCKDCELLMGQQAVDHSINQLLNNSGNSFKTSSLIELKIQKSGLTLRV